VTLEISLNPDRLAGLHTAMVEQEREDLARESLSPADARRQMWKESEAAWNEKLLQEGKQRHVEYSLTIVGNARRTLVWLEDRHRRRLEKLVGCVEAKRLLDGEEVKRNA
jgi:hypothetical protein